jgi:hypothetical protein
LGPRGVDRTLYADGQPIDPWRAADILGGVSTLQDTCPNSSLWTDFLRSLRRCGRRGKHVPCGRLVPRIAFVHEGGDAVPTKCSQIFTGVSEGSVEDVGNEGQVETVCREFSICPELHSRVLEKWTGTQAETDECDGRIFHFSCGNYGEYGKRVRTHTRKTPLAVAPYRQKRISSARPASVAGSPPQVRYWDIAMACRSSLRFHALVPVFHAHGKCKDEYNQVQAGTAISAKRVAVVQCGQREAGLDAVAAGKPRSERWV